jgi:cell division protein FtsW (lipid II flippase)
MTHEVLSKVEADMKIFGMGPVSDSQDPLVHPMKQTTADMVWTGVIYRWGYVGLILFILIYLFAIIMAYTLYMKTVEDISQLSLLLFLFIISQVLESFVSWTFLSGHGYAIGLWYFAVLSALLGINHFKTRSDENPGLETEGR